MGEPPSSPTTAPLPENSLTKSTSDKSVSTCQSRSHSQCSVSLEPEAVSGETNIFTENKPSSSTPNTKPSLNCGEPTMSLKSLQTLACHKLSKFIMTSLPVNKI